MNKTNLFTVTREALDESEPTRTVTVGLADLTEHDLAAMSPGARERAEAAIAAEDAADTQSHLITALLDVYRTQLDRSQFATLDARVRAECQGASAVVIANRAMTLADSLLFQDTGEDHFQVAHVAGVKNTRASYARKVDCDNCATAVPK